MLVKNKRKLTKANVVGVLALFLAIGCFSFLLLSTNRFSAAAFFSWVQNLWTGEATSTLAVYPANENNWSHYSSSTNIDFSSQVATSGLVSYWSFDGDTNDDFGTNDGVASGSPTYATGTQGQALSLDGNDDYIEIPHDSSLDLTASFTISAWVKKGEDWRQQTILSKGGNYALAIGEDNRPYFEIIDGSETNDGIGIGITARSFSIVYDGTIYRDSNADYNIYRYDGGTTWTSVGELPLPARTATVYNGKLFVGLSSVSGCNDDATARVYRYDGGTTWTDLGNLGNGGGGESSCEVNALVVYEGDLYAGVYNEARVYRYEGGTTWTDVGEGGYFGLTVYDGSIYGVRYGNNDIVRYDGGSTWTNIGGSFNGAARTINVFDNKMYVRSVDGYVYSYDGSSWVDAGLMTISTSSAQDDSFITYNNKLYGSDNGAMYRYDGGTSWTNISGSAGLGMVVYQGRIWSGYTTLFYGNGAAAYAGKEIGDNGFMEVLNNESETGDHFVNLAATYNGSVLNLYLDGEMVASTSYSMDIGTSSEPLRIGQGWGSNRGGRSKSGEDSFRGLIDEVRIYNRALSAEEIVGNYKAEKYGENGLFLTSSSSSITHTSDSDFNGTTASTSISSGNISLEYVGGVADDTPYSFVGTATPIFRSVGPSNDNELASGTASFTIDIDSAGNAVFSGDSLPSNVGVGDAVVYDTNDDNVIDSSDGILFIHSRTDNNNYVLRTESGLSTIASATSGNDTWFVYRSYTSLANAESGTVNTSIPVAFDSWSNGRDLVTNNEIWNIACYGDAADTQAVTVSGWNTATSTYLRIFTPFLSSEVGVSQRHDGVWNDGRYYLQPQNDVNCIEVNNSYVRIEGLQIYFSYSNTAYVYSVLISGGIENYVSNSIMRGPNFVTGTYDGGFRVTSLSAGSNYLYNSTIYDWVDSGYHGYGVAQSSTNTNNKLYVYNVTVANSGYGFWGAETAGKFYIKNSIAQDCVDGFVNVFVSSSTDYNISDISGDAINDSFSGGYTKVSFVSSSTKDFRLSVNDVSAKDRGADLSLDSYLSFSYDINKEVRPSGYVWDIGSDEYSGYVASGTYTSLPLSIANIDFGVASWTTSIATGTSLKFRTGTTSDMADAPTWSSCYEYWNGYDISNSSCVTDGQPYLQYQVGLSTINKWVSPVFSDITIYYDNYHASGSIVSSAFDWGEDAATMNGLSWTELVLANTNITTSLRTASTSGNLNSTSWFAVDRGDCSIVSGNASCGSSAISSGMQDGIDDRFVQYRVDLSSAGFYSPVLSEMMLTSEWGTSICNGSICDVSSSTSKISATISWTTLYDATSTLEYGTTLSYGFATSSDVATTSHSFVINGLVASTTYYFKITSTDATSTASSSKSFLTKPNMLGLNAAKVVWLDATHVRVTYDWTDDAQLLDWYPTLDADITRGDSTVTIQSGSTDIRSMIWDYRMMVSEVDTNAAAGASHHINIYSNLNDVWYGQFYAPSQSLGHVWNDWGSFWSTGDSSGAPLITDSSWNEYIIQASSTDLRCWTSASSTWYQSSGVYYPVYDKRLALGAYGGSSEYGLTTITGEVESLSLIDNVSSSTFSNSAILSFTTDAPASSTIEYGTSLSFGLSTSSSDYLYDHDFSVSGLEKDVLYYFRIKATDILGNSVSSDVYTFTPQDDYMAPVIASTSYFTGSTSATIYWATNEPATSTVQYGPTNGYGFSSSSDVFATDHSINIDGLSLGNTYHFKVLSSDASGNLSSSTDESFVTKDLFPEIKYHQAGWINTSTVRFIYDWTDDDQLLDWSSTTNTSLTRGTSTVTISGGGVDVLAMIWNQTMAASRLSASVSTPFSSHVNYYTNLDGSWAGVTAFPNPSIGNVWIDSYKFWVLNGSTNNYSSDMDVRGFHNYEFKISPTLVKSWTDADGIWYQRADSYSPSTDGYIALGAYGGTSYYGQVIMEGQLPPASSISSVATSTDASSVDISWTTDGFADSLIEYGTTLSYGSSFSDSSYIHSHSFTLSGLSGNTNYYYSITSTDVYGDSVVYTGSFQTANYPSATPIYRSVGPSNTNELASGTATALLTIDASGNATFSGTTIPNNVGVGDAIVYDTDNSNTITSADDIVFIHGRSSSTAYTVKTQFGANTATTTTANDTWFVYRAYTSLFNAEASVNNTSILPSYDSWSNGKDISYQTGSNEVWNIACYGDAVDTTQVTINDWSTAADNYIRIYTPTSTSEVGISQRHNGVWDDSKYNMSVSYTVSSGVMIDIRENYVFVSGLQTKLTSSYSDYSLAIRNIGQGGEVVVSNNIVWGVLTGSGSGLGIAAQVSSYGDYEVYNNIVYGFLNGTNDGRAITSCNNGSGSNYFYNNTTFGNYIGFDNGCGADPILKNNISYNNTNDFWGAMSASSTNNAYVGGSAPGSSNLNISAYASTSVFIDPASGDFRIRGDSPAVDQGADLSADKYLSFGKDIQGQSRPNNIAWDIGADEYYDEYAPVITSFTIPSVSSSTTIAINSFGATDDVAVTGYIITESATTPSLLDSRWETLATTTYAFVLSGRRTLYAWVKDGNDNISAYASSTILVDTSAPFVSEFNIGKISSSSVISINTFSGLNDYSWSEANVHQDWTTFSMSADGSVVLGGSYYGYSLYLSSNYGIDWEQVEPVSVPWLTSAMSADGSTIVAGGANYSRLYLSTTTGSTWHEIRPIGDVSVEWDTLSISPDGSVLLAGVQGGRLYISTSTGATWKEIRPAGDVNKNWQLSSISSDGSVMVVGVNGGRLYRSVNGGKNWSEIQPAGSTDKTWWASSISYDGSVIVVGVNGGRLYISTNSGVSWNEVRPNGDIDVSWYTSSLSSSGSTIFVGTAPGRSYVSRDYGVSWNEVGPNGDNDTYWEGSAMSSDGSLIVTGGMTSNSIYIGSNETSDISGYLLTETINTPSIFDLDWSLVPENTYDFVSDGVKYLYAWVKDEVGNVSTPSRSSIFIDSSLPNISLFSVAPYSTSSIVKIDNINAVDSNMNINWSETMPAGNADMAWRSSVFSADGTTVLAGAYYGRLYVSTTTGLIWSEVRPAGDVDRNWSTISMSLDNNTIISGAFGGRLYLSTSTGRLWSEVRPAGNSNQTWSTTAMSSNGSTILAGVNNGRLYLSANGGKNWTEQIPAGSVNKFWKSSAMSDDGLIIIVGAQYGRLYFSSNGGDSWSEVRPVGDVDMWWNTISISADGSVIIAGVNNGTSGRLYISTDSGNSWSETMPAGNVNRTWSSSAISDNGGVMVVAAYGGLIYVSFDHGLNWMESAVNDYSDMNWQTLSISGDGLDIISGVSTGRAYLGKDLLHYILSESSSAPSIYDAGWTIGAPDSYTFASAGSKTLYAWAMDNAKNVSLSTSTDILVDDSAPTVTAFTIPSGYGSLIVPISTFTASDDNAVTGYLVTNTASTPSLFDTAWEVTPTSTYIFATEGAKTLYAWAKDAAGNISSSMSDTVTVTIPPATPIYRSVGPSNTNELASGTATALLTIDASGNATFSGTTIPNNVGVGDAIVYDSNNDNILGSSDDVVFIHGRDSGTSYSVRDQFGNLSATTTSANDTWALYRSYTSLFNAEAGTINASIPVSFDVWSDGRDLTASTGANEIWNIACYGDGIDATAVDINGWTTSADDYIKMYTPTSTSEVGVSQRHNGVWDDAKYSIQATNSGSVVYNTGNNHLRIDGLQIGIILSDNSDWHAAMAAGNAPDFHFSNNIVRGNITGSSQYSIGVAFDNSSSAYVWNNIIYGFVNGGNVEYGIFSTASNAYIYSNTIFNSQTGISANGIDVMVKNNLIFGSSDSFNGTLDASSTNNAYSEGADLGSSGLDISGYASTSVFMDPANNDFRIRYDSPVRDMGADLSSDLNLAFSTDIEGQSRPYGASWDIGADEFNPASDIIVPVISSISTSTATTSVTITFSTDEMSTSTVYYGTTTSYGYSSTTDTIATSNIIYISNLSASTTYYFYIEATDGFGNTSTSTSDTFTTSGADNTAPTVTAFDINATSSSLIVNINTFTATDNVSVTGYLVNQVASTPSLSDSAWETTPTSTYTFATEGAKTLYAWAKDAAGNINSSMSDTVIVDMTAPIVSTFTIPTYSSSTGVSIISLTGSDGSGSGIAGYLVNESSLTPSISDSSWETSATSTYNFATEGNKTLYAWIKDNADNISSSSNDSVLVDVTIPTVDSFTTPATSSSLMIDITSFTASDAGSGVVGYLISESSSTPSLYNASWESSATTTYTFSSSGTSTLYAWARDNAGNISIAAISSVVVMLDAYNVGGTVSGLSGTVVLRNNGYDDVSVSANGAFVFPTQVYDGFSYIVAVLTNPSGQTCSVSNGSGVVSSTDVTDIAITCTTNYVPPSSGGGGGGGGGGSVGDYIAPFITNIMATSTPTSTIISWVTNEAANSLVEYGLTTGYGQTFSSAAYSLIHSLNIVGLLSDTIYHYRVKSADSYGNTTISLDGIFHTLINTISGDDTTVPDTEVEEGTESQTTDNTNSPRVTSLIGVPGPQADAITKQETEDLLTDLKEVPLTDIEKIIYQKIVALAERTLTQDDKYAIAYFIHYGTPTTVIIGAGERGGSIASFRAAFGRLPNSFLDWQDVIKIANGRWPTQRSQSAEEKARLKFKKIYLRDPNMKDAHDNAGVTVMAYGLRPAQRSLESEKASIKSFKYIYKKNPATAEEWDIVRAIAYSGAKR